MSEQIQGENLLARLNGKNPEKDTDQAMAAAAGHIAGAIATAYFGPVAGPLVDEAVAAIAGALLAADDDRFEKEIIRRLDVIEKKIDSIITFLNTEFREIVTEIIEKNEIERLVDQLDNDAISIQAAISAYNKTKHPEIAAAQGLVDKAEIVLKTGRLLFKRSKDRYLMALPYFATAVSALNLARKRYPQFTSTIGIWADQYLADIRPWITQGLPPVTSFQEIKSRTLAELLSAQGLLKDFSIGVPVNYINLVGDSYKLPPPQDGFPSMPVFERSYAFAAKYTLDAEFKISVTDLKAYKFSDKKVSAVDDLRAIYGDAGHPAFPPIFGSIGLRNVASYWDFYTSIYTAFQVAAPALRYCPARLEALDFAISVLVPFSDGLKELAVLNKQSSTPTKV